MNRVLLICRSQTEALMAYRILEGGGIRGALTRPPREERTSSCSYAVRIMAQDLSMAQRRLQEKRFYTYKVKHITN